MPRGVYERKQKDESAMESETAAQMQPSEKMFPVLLTKNYVPAGGYEIVGYLKEAVKRKDAAGGWRVVEPEEFIKGEMKPHTSHGVGFGKTVDESGKVLTNAKIWAGTHIKLPVDEAKSVIAKKIAERADAILA
jgi:hypothetical protein